MADFMTKEKRSYIMSKIQSKNTKPELLVRKLVFALGYRYRLHYGKLPGKPDLAFVSKKKVIFVHGCFWHQHKNCKQGQGKIPTSNINYWKPKLNNNAEKDIKTQYRLKELGWDYLIVWECEIDNSERLKKKIVRFLQK